MFSTPMGNCKGSNHTEGRLEQLAESHSMHPEAKGGELSDVETRISLRLICQHVIQTARAGLAL